MSEDSKKFIVFSGRREGPIRIGLVPDPLWELMDVGERCHSEILDVSNHGDLNEALFACIGCMAHPDRLGDRWFMLGLEGAEKLKIAALSYISQNGREMFQ